MQIIADTKGNIVHLGERDCSLQRRHQKVLEEATSPGLTLEESKRICDITYNAIKKLGYRGVGTVEYLYENGEFYFIEMNTRLQVEHTISEMITGIDLVREQIKVAAGQSLTMRQEEISFRGHAIECRINAEDPVTFMPSPGLVTEHHVPGGLGVRVDSALYKGYQIPPYYDSLISKLIVHGPSREECILRLSTALDEYIIEGVKTTLPLHKKIICQTDFLQGKYDIHWLENFLQSKALDTK